ncbi:hypothetical protein [Lysinibacter sp. HNR]|uniref:hypothetical protein n=1 Tax=Lysinibacter sp. HNR TaxID=3031408 RepID=UPI0024358B02|nr:hypothetical protein [Lysinibacter sp. HNR]WGD37596.1 hypothetical protein FrondiHNR_01340 [Lysinibacter sp. HNR]
MPSYNIKGGKPLIGAVQPEGFKHAFVTVLAASFLGQHDVTIAGAPTTQLEASTLLTLLEAVGASVSVKDDKVSLGINQVSGSFPQPLYQSIHGSLYLVPGLLAHTGEVTMHPAGGCAIGNGVAGGRPMSHYFEVLRRYGAIVDVTTGSVRMPVGGLRGTVIDLVDFVDDPQLMTGPLYSGATKFAILCAAISSGVSIIRSAYPKADVTEMVRTLQLLGADIEIDSEQDIMRIQSGSLLSERRNVVHHLISDPMQTLTWLVAGVMTGGDVHIDAHDVRILRQSMQAECEALTRMGFEIHESARSLSIANGARPIKGIDLKIHSRGVFSDAQPIFALLMTKLSGFSTIIDTVWRRRYEYVQGLNALGGSIRKTSSGIRIAGGYPPSISDVRVTGTDLRAAVSLVLAGTAINGTTMVYGVEHLDRGFTNFASVLESLGGSVTREGFE